MLTFAKFSQWFLSWLLTCLTMLVHFPWLFPWYHKTYYLDFCYGSQNLFICLDFFLIVFCNYNSIVICSCMYFPRVMHFSGNPFCDWTLVNVMCMVCSISLDHSHSVHKCILHSIISYVHGSKHIKVASSTQNYNNQQYL